MARNILVINCDLRETRVALIENGVIAELHIERANARGTVGNVVLGKVTRVLPGMQAAFIDVGMERAAFLHVEDLIRPDDFDAYLSGAHREEHDPSGRGEGGRRRHTGVAAIDEEEDDDDEPIVPAVTETPPLGATEEEDELPISNGEAGHADDVPSALHAAPSAIEATPLIIENAGPIDETEPVAPAEAIEDEGAEPEEAEELDAELEAETEAEEGELPENGDEEEELEGAEGVEVVAEEGPLAAAAPAEAPAELGASEAATLPGIGRRVELKRGRRQHRRRRGGKDEKQAKKSNGAAPDRDRREGREGRERGVKSQLRVSRSVPITEVVKDGDAVIVQISKEPIGTKGARVTSHVSLPGRYVVYLPTVEHVGVSKRIGPARERQRLREVIDSVKPPRGGLIVRTVAEGLTKKQLKADIGYLIRLWFEIAKKRETAKAPAILYAELDIVLRTARDLFTDEIEKIVLDDKEQHSRLVRFVEMFLPERAKDIELYTGREPIFDAYGIEDEIGRALSRKVPLPSGGYLIIDQAEALTAIDVNTGRFVGKGSKDLEETALKTNLEAVDEIAYQLRFRNIGGLVILDLIDMEVAGNRDKVWRALEQALARDKAKTTLNRISDLGLIEMTRKRTRESLSRTVNEPCFYCDGTGQIQSRHTIAYEILRQIRRERETLPGYVVTVNAHPAIVDLLTGEEKAAVQEAERRYMRRIELVARREYHIEQFDLQGR